MVGTTGLEPATSSVSRLLYIVLSPSYRPLETAKPRGNTPKAEIQQVILQAKNEQGSLASGQAAIPSLRSSSGTAADRRRMDCPAVTYQNLITMPAPIRKLF